MSEVKDGIRHKEVIKFVKITVPVLLTLLRKLFKNLDKNTYYFSWYWWFKTHCLNWGPLEFGTFQTLKTPKHHFGFCSITLEL